MNNHHLPNTHEGLTQRSWQWIRAGLRRCRENPADRQCCLDWCARFPACTARWVDILQNPRHEMLECSLHVENFFALPADVRDWWESALQNHPFAALFAPERYAALREQRERQRNDPLCD